MQSHSEVLGASASTYKYQRVERDTIQATTLVSNRSEITDSNFSSHMLSLTYSTSPPNQQFFKAPVTSTHSKMQILVISAHRTYFISIRHSWSFHHVWITFTWLPGHSRHSIFFLPSRVLLLSNLSWFFLVCF